MVLGVANGWEKRKGLKYMKYLSKHLPEEYQVVIVGLDREETDFGSNCTIIKRTTNIEEMVAFYSMACVFANPTLEDNFPTTNLEALACGTPVITFKTGGSPDAIDESCGLVVEKNSEALLAGVLNLSKRGITVDVCRKQAMQFDKNARFMDYVKLYERILENESFNKLC